MKLGETASNIRHRSDEAVNDVFLTPRPLAAQLIDETPWGLNDSLLDPFMGRGAFFDQFPKAGKEYWCEIEKGSDFFRWVEPIDWIMSNPPFSKLSQVFSHSCRIAQKGFAYLIPTYSLTHKRIKDCSSFGFNISRIVFFPNPKEWQLGFQMCWVVFEKKRFLTGLHPIKTLDVNDKNIQSRLPLSRLDAPSIFNNEDES